MLSIADAWRFLSIFSLLLEDPFELRRPLGNLLLPPLFLLAPAFRLGDLVRELAALVRRVAPRHVGVSSFSLRAVSLFSPSPSATIFFGDHRNG